MSVYVCMSVCLSLSVCTHSDLHNAESGSDTTGGHGQSITLVVKTDSDDEHVQPGNPPLLLTSAADAHMARIPGEAFTDFSTTLAMVSTCSVYQEERKKRRRRRKELRDSVCLSLQPILELMH